MESGTIEVQKKILAQRPVRFSKPDRSDSFNFSESLYKSPTIIGVRDFQERQGLHIITDL